MANIKQILEEFNRAKLGKDVKAGYIKGVEAINTEVESTTKLANDKAKEMEDYKKGIEANESARQNAEKVRASAETARVNADKGREDAEKVRATSETLRVNAERARENSEKIRVANEANRAKAENDRVTDETAREKYIKDFKRLVAQGAFKGEKGEPGSITNASAKDIKTTSNAGTVQADLTNIEIKEANDVKDLTSKINANATKINANVTSIKNLETKEANDVKDLTGKITANTTKITALEKKEGDDIYKLTTTVNWNYNTNKGRTETNASKIDEVSTKLEQLSKDLINRIYPIGIIVEFTNGTDPNKSIGGKWEKYGDGRVTIAQHNTDKDFANVGQVGGTKNHIHGADEKQNGSLTATIGAAYGKPAEIAYTVSNDYIGKAKATYTATGTGFRANDSFSHYTSVIGNTAPANSLPWYVVVARWRRIG